MAISKETLPTKETTLIDLRDKIKLLTEGTASQDLPWLFTREIPLKNGSVSLMFTDPTLGQLEYTRERHSECMIRKTTVLRGGKEKVSEYRFYATQPELEEYQYVTITNPSSSTNPLTKRQGFISKDIEDMQKLVDEVEQDI